MAIERITDQQIIETISDDASLLVIQKNEAGKEILYETTLQAIVNVLKEKGITDGCVTEDFINELKPSIVKEITAEKDKISVTLLDDSKKEYTIDTIFFDSASVDDDGYLHIFKAEKEVIDPVLIPALRENIAEITCRNVGYVFEEVAE